MIIIKYLFINKKYIITKKKKNEQIKFNIISKAINSK